MTTSFSLPSAHQILRFSRQLASLIDRAVLLVWHQVFVESFGINSFTRAGQPAAEGVAAAMADAAAQPAVAQAGGHAGGEGWAAFFAEAFQASTFKSYWGMLHYLTSRWAFTCFAMVCDVLCITLKNMLTISGSYLESHRGLWSVTTTNPAYLAQTACAADIAYCAIPIADPLSFAGYPLSGIS